MIGGEELVPGKISLEGEGPLSSMTNRDPWTRYFVPKG